MDTGSERMKAFVASLAALAFCGFVAYSALTSLDRSAQDVYQSDRGSVRF